MGGGESYSDVIIRVAEGPAVTISKAVYEALLVRKCTWRQP
jgi:predicted CopG family antitoxin